MSPLGKTIVVVLAIANIAAGRWLLYEQWVISRDDAYAMPMSIGGGLLIIVGIVLLWEESIAPLITRKNS